MPQGAYDLDAFANRPKSNYSGIRVAQGGKPNRKRLEHVINETVNRLDLRTPYSEEFYRSIREAEDFVQKALYEDMKNKNIFSYPFW